MQDAYAKMAPILQKAIAEVNPEILSTAAQAGADVKGAAATGAQGATDAAGNLYNLLSPYMSVGAKAAGELGDASRPFTADMMAKYSPAYQFQLQQGKTAADRAAAAAGLTGSGGTIKSLNRYVQDYAGTAFERASNLYNQDFNRIKTLADMGMSAGTTAGNAGLQAAEFGAGLNTGAAQWAGGADINARNLVSQNTLGGANYLADTILNSAKAHAQGDLGAASSWNNMLSGIGSVGDTLLFGGLNPGGAGAAGPAWSFGNLGKNLWGGATRPGTAPAPVPPAQDFNW